LQPPFSSLLRQSAQLVVIAGKATTCEIDGWRDRPTQADGSQ
jgi:hypothetical protein